jgi:hypothetical protein
MGILELLIRLRDKYHTTIQHDETEAHVRSTSISSQIVGRSHRMAMKYKSMVEDRNRGVL